MAWAIGLFTRSAIFAAARDIETEDIGVAGLVEIGSAEMVPVARLRSAVWNANRVPDKMMAKIRRSIETFGFVENLVVRPLPSEDGAFEVLSGNHRLQILLELGVEAAPVVVVDVDDPHARILAQALNRTRGEDDPEAYARLVEDVLRGVEVDRLVEFLPETPNSIDRVLAVFRPPVDEDEVPPVPPLPRSKRGEVYELGNHRLMCGDVTVSADMETLVGSLMGLVEALWTDPPYGVNYVGKTKDELTIANDDAEGLRAFLAAAFMNVDRALAPSARFYVAGPAGPRGTDFRLAITDVGWTHHQTLVWVKNSMVLGHSDHHYRHEDVLYGWKPGPGRAGRGRHDGSKWYGGHDETTVFEVDRPSRSEEHPTMKPVALIERHLRNSTASGDVVLDVFAGSGSTLIAAESTGRQALLMELDPAYCDVIRDRYARFVDG